MMICLKSITFMSFYCCVKGFIQVYLCVCVCVFAVTCAFLFISQYDSYSLQRISPTAKLILRRLPLLAMQSFI